MTIIHFSSVIVAGGGETTPTFALSGESAISQTVDFGQTAKAGIRINADGTIDARTGDNYTQIDAATDWAIPNSTDKSGCRFRCTNNGDTLMTGSSATGSWLTAACEWWVEEVAAEGTKSLNLTVEISTDSGSTTHDTGVYTGSANVNPI